MMIDISHIRIEIDYKLVQPSNFDPFKAAMIIVKQQIITAEYRKQFKSSLSDYLHLYHPELQLQFNIICMYNVYYISEDIIYEVIIVRFKLICIHILYIMILSISGKHLLQLFTLMAKINLFGYKHSFDI